MNICARLGDRGFGCGGYLPEDLWRHNVLKRQLVPLVFPCVGEGSILAFVGRRYHCRHHITLGTGHPLLVEHH